MSTAIFQHPDTQSITPYASMGSKKLHEAADRALNHYLNPPSEEKPASPTALFVVAPDVDCSKLLAMARDSLASASLLVSDFVGYLEGSQRHTAMAIQQIIMLAELAVNRVADCSDGAASASSL
ncbi:DUF6124 family protein [Pseudomonas violetae]|jgi:hypothetical protein|uniref:DUF6124 family protein n=1 Tax=Pseudomonas violetae TaxID=2915813 RepID=A0ABT0F7Y4_9PSED|nr:DUF6124 family protein [Pseudomonas violetae]MCK1794138.1 DUF6124 family protein [Pseudomonas violetae]